MNQLKKLIINAAMEKFDKIYIHALPHNKLIVGERGLINTEKNNGIVLAIGSSSCSEFKMEDDFIFAKLRFNGVWEDVFIPYEAVDAVLNDLHKPLCIFNFPYYEENNENGGNGKYIRRERYCGQCSRTFYVGENVRQEDIHAKFEDGILKLTVPKTQPAKIEEQKYISIEG